MIKWAREFTDKYGPVDLFSPLRIDNITFFSHSISWYAIVFVVCCVVSWWWIIFKKEEEK